MTVTRLRESLFGGGNRYFMLEGLHKNNPSKKTLLSFHARKLCDVSRFSGLQKNLENKDPRK